MYFYQFFSIFFLLISWKSCTFAEKNSNNKNRIKDWLMIKSYFSKRDRQAIVALTLTILAGCGFLWVLGEYGKKHEPKEIVEKKGFEGKAKYYASEQNAEQLFCFDPNTADSTTLLNLGLRPWQVRNIYKYRSQGGIYRKPEDFARLYGLSAHKYKQLLPYIRIADEYRMTAAEYVGNTGKEENQSYYKNKKDNTYDDSQHGIYGDKVTTSDYPRKISTGEHITLNTADTAQLKRVPGIGSYYSKAIIRYGERLGGYVSVDQLDEIEGFPTEAKQFFIIDNPSPRQLNVNTMTLNELKRHPYINYYQAKAIVDYRRINGQIRSLQQLSTLPDFPEEAIKRLLPYVTY